MFGSGDEVEVGTEAGEQGSSELVKAIDWAKVVTADKEK